MTALDLADGSTAALLAFWSLIYLSRVRGYLAWLAAADIDGDPLAESAARDGAVRDYRAHLQTVAKRKPATINTTLAALGDFYTRLGLGIPNAARLDLPKRAPRGLDTRDSVRWLRAVERWLSPRDRVVALLPYYAGLRLGEVVALDVDDVQLSARKGVITVRDGKNRKYREIPVHTGQLLRVRRRTLPKPQMTADRRPVPLRCAPGPLHQAQVTSRHLQLPGHERRRVVVHLTAAARKPAVTRIELQPHGEDQP